MDNTTNIKTIIAQDIEITGSIKSASDIQLSGKLSGDLTCAGHALIGETAVIKGNITANSTSIQGQIVGNISVKDRIELKSTARISGDIRSKRLTVEDGVTFVGKAEVTPNGPAAAQQPAAPARAETIEDDAQSDDSKARTGLFNRK